LKNASKDFWYVNAIQFFDGLAYFSMTTVLVLFLTKNLQFSDIEGPKWMGIYTLLVTAFMFAVGSVCDIIGIKKSFFIGIGLTTVSRLCMGIMGFLLSAGVFESSLAQNIVVAMLVVLALGSCFTGPVTQTALRRFTTQKTRATGFNLYYLLMNVSAMLASAVVVAQFRNVFGEILANSYVMLFGAVISVFTMLCVAKINEHNYAEESERLDVTAPKKGPIALLMEVWKERPFQKLLLFLILTIAVRMVFTQQFMVMPTYYSRLLSDDAPIGELNAINPAIIVIGLILLIPVLNKYETVKLIVVGMLVSALSMFCLVIPPHWLFSVPGIDTYYKAYMFMIVAQIFVFAIGELIFSPRFTEYVASVAPKDKVASYMALSSLPMFIAKPINGLLSGILVSAFCYEGIRAKGEMGHVGFFDSPEWMWGLYALFALTSPLMVVLLKNVVTSNKERLSSEDMAEVPTCYMETGEQEAEQIK